MSYFSVDVECDGPVPGLYSMVQIGAVYVDPLGKLSNTFFGKLKPISDNYEQSCLDIFKVSREETLKYGNPTQIMGLFKHWIEQANQTYRPIFISDNNAFDWSFSHYYFERFIGLKQDPFGWSSRNLNDIFHGLKKDMRASFKRLRKVKHDHNPVHDAIGNAQALIAMRDKYGLKINL